MYFYLFYLESSPNSEVDLLMDKLGGDTIQECDVEAGKERKRNRRRRILYNLFDFLAIVTSISFNNYFIYKRIWYFSF